VGARATRARVQVEHILHVCVSNRRQPAPANGDWRTRSADLGTWAGPTVRSQRTARRARLPEALPDEHARRAPPLPAGARRRALPRRELPKSTRSTEPRRCCPHARACHPRLPSAPGPSPLRGAGHHERRAHSTRWTRRPCARVQSTTPAIQRRLVARPRYVLHFAPAPSSWLDPVVLDRRADGQEATPRRAQLRARLDQPLLPPNRRIVTLERKAHPYGSAALRAVLDAEVLGHLRDER
jgi:hypothetical protein